jgi:hypothetical protein
MRRRIFPRFVYTRPFGWVLAGAVVLVLIRSVQAMHDESLFLRVFGIWSLATFGLAELWLIREILAPGPFLDVGAQPTTTRAIPYTAYLGVTIDTRNLRVVRACFYSQAASAVTTMDHEYCVDIDAWDAETFGEALDVARTYAPKSYPWLVPLLRASGDLPHE